MKRLAVIAGVFGIIAFGGGSIRLAEAVPVTVVFDGTIIGFDDQEIVVGTLAGVSDVVLTNMAIRGTFQYETAWAPVGVEQSVDFPPPQTKYESTVNRTAESMDLGGIISWMSPINLILNPDSLDPIDLSAASLFENFLSGTSTENMTITQRGGEADPRDLSVFRELNLVGGEGGEDSELLILAIDFEVLEVAGLVTMDIPIDLNLAGVSGFGSFSLLRTLPGETTTYDVEAAFQLNSLILSSDGPTPNVIPEPSSIIAWSLIGLTFAGIGWRRRRLL